MHGWKCVVYMLYINVKWLDGNLWSEVRHVETLSWVGISRINEVISSYRLTVSLCWCMHFDDGVYRILSIVNVQYISFV